MCTRQIRTIFAGRNVAKRAAFGVLILNVLKAAAAAGNEKSQRRERTLKKPCRLSTRKKSQDFQQNNVSKRLPKLKYFREHLDLLLL